MLAAGVVGFVLSSRLSLAALDAWGWRLAFLLGVGIVPLGLLLRRGLPETLDVVGHAATPAAERLPKARILVVGLLVLGTTGITNYTLEYTTTYAQDSLHMAPDIAFGATVVLGLFTMVCDLLSGMLTDKVGRKPVMLSAVGLMFLLTAPAYMAMIRAPSLMVIYAAMALLSILNGFFSGPSLTAITEALPKGVRSGVLGTLYAVAMASFGGSTQFIVKWLIGATGSPLAAAWYLTGALAMGGAAMLFLRETAPVKTGEV